MSVEAATERARRRIERAGPEIPVTSEQIARAHAGERITFSGLAGVAAARRLVSLMLTCESVKVGFDRQERAVLVLEVDERNPAGWKVGDHVVDYSECASIKAIVDRAEDEWQEG